MSESGLSETSAENILESWRRDGCHRQDPVRFHYMEVLSQRLQSQQDAVRGVLTEKLGAALNAYREQLALTSEATIQKPRTNTVTTQGTGHASLAELNRYIRSATDVGTDTQVTGETVAPPEMKSVRHFKHAWSRMRAQDQVLKAVQQGPENAGPLNSHRLVLRSLSLMRDLSPDYLQRFLSHTESLLWLDHLSVKIAAMDSKTARRSRPKKQ